MAITIKEIAEKANTSIATVSRVINNCSNVAPGTRKRILDIMHAHNYRKNQLAGGLASGRSQVLALITPDEEDFHNAHYFKQVFLGISNAASENGYCIMVNQHDKNHFPVDGYLLISPAVNNPLVGKLHVSKTPVILINRKLSKMNWVDINNISAISEIVNHLTKLGHRHIGIITGGDNIQNSVERITGYEKALNENNIEFNPEYVIEGDFTEKTAYEQINKLVSENLTMTALVACNDLMAVGAIRAIMDNNIRVPEDIAVVGFDDIDGICFFNPPITTFRQPFFDMGKSAVNLLVNQIEGETEEPVNREFNGKLVLRESCGAHLNRRLFE